MRVSVSGAGNVAQYAVEKAMALGAKVVTVSDSSGTVIDEAGFTAPNGVKCVAEGANMPSTLEAVKVFEQGKVLCAPVRPATRAAWPPRVWK